MAFNPTPSQSLAIETKNKTLLISAAAGSGKTRTLTERIIRSLTEDEPPADISRMLIVTFTRAAAAELRERITGAISDALAKDPFDEHLNKQALLVGSADICTIDSFCLDVVKSNFQRLEIEEGLPLSPDFRVADTAELTALRTSLMNDLIEEWYDKPAEGINFAAFAENLASMRDDGKLGENLLKFAERTSSYKNSDSFAQSAAADLLAAAGTNEFFASKPGKVTRELTRDRLEYYKKLLEDAIDYLNGVPTAEAKYIPAFAGDLKTVNDALAALDVGYKKTRDVLSDYSALGLKALGKYADDLTNYYKTRRDTVKTGLIALRKSHYSMDPEMLVSYAGQTAAQIETLGAFIAEYRRRLMHEKALRRICDFSDVQRLAHTLLVAPDGSPTEVALSLHKKYDEVYIDEYQDVDPIQDEIFAAIARPDHRFMVGDIKQSIYGFRGSDPSIFGGYRRKFKPVGSGEEAEGYSIFTSKNFRCGKQIINFTNLVSHATFGVVGGDIDYRPSDDLEFGDVNPADSPVKLVFVREPERDSEVEFAVDSGEVRYVTREIVRLISSGRRPDDIAVLVRAGKVGHAISDALALAGVPTTDSTSSDYFTNPEILLILSLLSIIDDPHRDVRLAAALRSPVFEFTMDDLAKIRQSADRSCSLFEALDGYSDNGELEERCKKFEETLEELRRDARSLPLDRLIRSIFSRFSLTSLELPDGIRTPAQIRDNILRFYEYARAFAEQRNGDLASFIKYIDDVVSAGIKTESSAVKAEGKVSVMTVHKSKGLEFPVVFFCGCGVKFNRDDLKKNLIYDPDGGIGMQIPDETGFARIDTPIRAAVLSSAANRETAEEMRILYVALTRARDLLYVTADVEESTLKKLEGDLRAGKYNCRYLALSATRFLDWLLPISASGDPSFEISLIFAEEIPDTVKANLEATKENTNENKDLSALKKCFYDRFERKYSHEAALAIPAKLSVSVLTPTVLEDDGAEDLNADKLPKLTQKPLFMLDDPESAKRASAAERGTATHVFLQFCDFELAERTGIRSELSRLVTERFIPEATAELVNLRQLELFFESRLYSSLKRSRRLYREQRFNLFLPASDFAVDKKAALSDSGEQLLVQGVIDLVFEDENGDVTLCDYKTDYLTEDELADPRLAKEKLTQRYKNQLSYYEKAVEKLFGKKPGRVCIYSLPLGDTVDIETN